MIKIYAESKKKREREHGYENVLMKGHSDS